MNRTDIIKPQTQSTFKDITGQKFNRLTVLGVSASTPKWPYMWVVKCDCGNIRVSGKSHLSLGKYTSCGCRKAENKSTHGATRKGSIKTQEYGIWEKMKARCYNPSQHAYHRYGGRGILMCERWRTSFSAFYEDMGKRPSKLYQIDRIDNDGPYSPENCRWVTRKEQSRNKSTNVLLHAFGETLCVTDWANRLGITTSSLSKRLRKGWPLEVALSTPRTLKFNKCTHAVHPI
jgi:hypothetical protein